jgi:hypothetical protein
MKANGIDRFAIPDAQGAEPIEDLVARLRRDISSECAVLLKRTRRVNAASDKIGSFRLKLWESRINRIIEAQASTFSIDELEGLRRDCDALSEELGRFDRRPGSP